ncbi:MAG: hypothetical protein SH859_07580 [Hyphomicrobium aestuarii]|nr:hypothetical protein [Hyphomicrobium aestuarii]
MHKSAIVAAAMIFAAAPATAAPECGKVVDELSKAISGHLTMSPEQKVSALRMTTSAYDSCMVGDTKTSNATRDMIMAQVRKQLGSPN